MSRYAPVFFACAIAAALVGFSGFGGAAAGGAQVLFFVFAILAIASGLYRLISSIASSA